MENSIVIALALAVFILSVWQFIAGLKCRRFSALFWLALILFFTCPACIDVIFGLPIIASVGPFGRYFSLAEQGLSVAFPYVFGYTVLIILGQYAVRRILRPLAVVRQKSWLFIALNSHRSELLFGSCFLLACAIALWSRRDLTRDFSDFLADDAKPEYETYFLLASSPLMAIVGLRRGFRSPVAVGIYCIIFVASYFIGIRFYMLPFIGYALWREVLEAKRFRTQLLSIVSVVVVAWLGVTVWGVVRLMSMRNSPLAALRSIDPATLTSTLAAGNELSARLALYDLTIRINGKGQMDPASVLAEQLKMGIYPAILQATGSELPSSTSKRIYDLESGTSGTGISTGATVYGWDLFNFGWWGVLGGIAIGTFLAIVDLLQQRSSGAWMFCSPILTWSLVFLARGGADATLVPWGRAMPLAMILAIIAYMEIRDTRTSPLPSLQSPRPESSL